MTGSTRMVTLVLGILSFPVLLLSGGMALVGDTTGFMPHGHCYLWQPSLVTLHVSTDLLIGVSYVVIASTLAFFVFRARRRLPFSWMFLAFGTFIIACGATHFMEVWTLWWPDYWTSGGVKALTAVASVATAIALPPLVPRALGLMDAERVSEERRVALLERQRLLEEARVATAAADRARHEAEEANRTKDQFLAIVSHELRTPLSPILTWARLLRTRPETRSGIDEALAAIERAAQRQAQIVDELLDVSRINAGKLRLDVQPIELDGVIRSALETVRPAADAKGITLDCALEAQAGSVSGDPARLQQVLWNLVGNAIKFTPRGGRVTVQLRRSSDQAEIIVLDTGCGVAPEKLPHLFERFWQADSSATRTHGGLGLGLAIVKHLVELHGGTVQAASDGLDRGTAFRVRLPLRTVAGEERRAADASSPAAEAPVAASGTTRLDGRRVLVVDDDEDTAHTLDVLLTVHGAEVRTASSARDGIALVDGWLPDVVLSDLGMPGEDGFALLERLRALPPERGGNVPVVALTAFARIEDRVRVLASGFAMHVVKPVDPAELIGVVASLVQRAPHAPGSNVSA
jgi:signal transduction histidine kinase/ActR/RegA family two-component response regulator